MNRSLVTVMVVGASAIVSVVLAGFGAPSLSNFNQYYSGRAGGPSGGIWQNLMALIAPESGSTTACPLGYSWQPVGQTQSEPPTILYGCVADPKSKTNPANCPAWPTCLRALVPAGCTCTAPSVESPKETESSETIIQYNAGPTDSLTFSNEQTEPADCAETVLCQAADGTNYEVCGSLQGPNPCRSSLNPPQCPTWPTCLRANVPAGCTCVAPAVEVVQPGTEGRGSAPVVAPIEPATAMPSPSPTTSLLRRFLPLPVASPLAALPPSVSPIAMGVTSPSPEPTSSSSWLSRVRQNITSFWQRLF